MEKSIKVAQINTWDKEENSLGVPVRERYERFFKAAAQGGGIDIVGAQEIISVEDFAEVAAQYGLPHYGLSLGEDGSGGGTRYVGVFSRYPVVKHTPVDVENAQCVFAAIDVDGVRVGVYSIHNSFGFAEEHNRLENLYRIREHLRSEGIRGNNHMAYGKDMVAGDDGAIEVALIVGDLNAEPDSDSIRYLTGKHTYKGTSTLWLGRVHAATSVPAENAFERKAAAERGADLESAPRREIDYILSYGWCYGTRGYPQQVKIVQPLLNASKERLEYSDHLAVNAIIKL